MIRLYDFDEVRPEEILNRDIRAEADVEATVDAIIADVRARGQGPRIVHAQPAGGVAAGAGEVRGPLGQQAGRLVGDLHAAAVRRCRRPLHR